MWLSERSIWFESEVVILIINVDYFRYCEWTWTRISFQSLRSIGIAWFALVWWKLQYEELGIVNNKNSKPAYWALELSISNSEPTDSVEIVHKRKLGRPVYEISQHERSLKRKYVGTAQRNHYFKIVKPRWDS